MTIDLKAYPADVRKKLISIGRGFSSEDVLAQAEQTLAALEQHGPVLEDFGFLLSEDGQELRAAYEQLGGADVARGEARSNKHVASSGYVSAFKEAKKARLRGRAVAMTILRVLERRGLKEAADQVKGILRQTTIVSDTAKGMATQLDLLGGILADEVIAPIAKVRKGPETTALLAERAAALREASQGRANRRGTPMETQDMDQLDGIIVGHVREARRCAIAAAEELGNPALAEAFKLDKLYRTYRRKGDVDLPEEHDGEADDDGDDADNDI